MGFPIYPYSDKFGKINSISLVGMALACDASVCRIGSCRGSWNFCATSFKMESVNIAICAVCVLMTILHVIDIIGRVKGGEESSGDDSEGDSNPLL